MIETAVLLWEQDSEFRKKLKEQPCICLPHYRMFVEHARRGLPTQLFGDFSKDVSTVVNTYFVELREEVSWFCKKVDYRYDDEPWVNAKDAVERAIKFTSGDIHKGENPLAKK